MDYFGAREDNFKRTIKYLLQKSILVEVDGAYVISEEAIHQEFRESKGGKLLEGYLHRVGREHQEYREEGQMANHRISEEKIEAALRGELDWYEQMMLGPAERTLIIK
jgi:hypothetical protein